MLLAPVTLRFGPQRSASAFSMVMSYACMHTTCTREMLAFSPERGASTGPSFAYGQVEMPSSTLTCTESGVRVAARQGGGGTDNDCAALLTIIYRVSGLFPF